jgi:cell division protein FtsL
MAAEKENSEKKESSKKAATGSIVKELLSGSIVSEKIILSNLGYIAMMTILLAFYIANRFHAEKITRETTRLTREVKDMRAEALSTSADLMFLSRQSEVYNLVKEKGLNLEELKSPPYKLIVSK